MDTETEKVPTLEAESANTPDGLPTLEPEVPTLSANTSGDVPEALATGDIEVIDIANAEIEVRTRMEPRYNEHGKLRGIVWRERNKDRKTTWYVGAKSTGQRKEQYDNLRPQFEKE